MSAVDLALAIVLALVFAAAFGALFDLAPLIAKAMVRQAARWWHSELDTPEELAAEWEALIETRPVGIMKIGTGMRFLVCGMFRHGQFAIERRAKDAPGQLTSAMLWVSGARREILENCPSERPRYIAFASSILVTAVIAGASLFFALASTLRISLWVAVFLAFIWGFFFMSLDRFLAISQSRQGNPWQRVLVALPRIALALLLGLIISTPMVLQVFRQEIDHQLAVIQTQRSDAYFAQLASDPLSKRINQDRVRVSSLELASSPAARGATTSSVTAARFMLHSAEQTLLQDESQQRHLTAEFIKSNENSGGLLLRLQALNEISQGDSTLNAARWLLILFVTLVECMPVLIRILMLLGPESLYEKMAASKS